MENFMPYYIWGLQPHHLFRKQANQSSPFHLCTALYSDAKFYTAINQCYSSEYILMFKMGGRGDKIDFLRQ